AVLGGMSRSAGDPELRAPGAGAAPPLRGAPQVAVLLGDERATQRYARYRVAAARWRGDGARRLGVAVDAGAGAAARRRGDRPPRPGGRASGGGERAGADERGRGAREVRAAAGDFRAMGAGAGHAGGGAGGGDLVRGAGERGAAAVDDDG